MVKIIGAGFGRTGTTSLKVALEQLGFGPCYHMFEVLGDAEHLAHWERIVLEGQSPDWSRVFDGYQSTVDWPSTAYYKEIARAYPEAKVILTVREAEAWYRSTYNTLYKFAVQGDEEQAAAHPEVAERLDRLHRVVSKMIWHRTFADRFEEAEYAIKTFAEHNAEVARVIEPERLLVFEVRQGWAPLCEFLGVDVPDGDFPRVNDADSMPQVVGKILSGAGAPGPLAAS
ncbi:sulfotransferase family protein [Amycolatopsis nigrescens]|uniref:sulfotransferase family protein n=1 Tax=Amycolatopsis nigrescens TaxID=381445 RepID=UPI000364BDC9|nr:sulfotransferase family protein [Amycolatopsis nigrescens]